METQTSGFPIYRGARGSHSCTVTLYGVDIEITYDLDGRYLPATASDPAEYPDVLIITVDMGGGPVSGENATQWEDTLCLVDAMNEQGALK